MITVLLLGAVAMTTSHPVAASTQESMQNNFKKLLPQIAHPQKKVQKSTLNIKPVPKMVYGQENTQKSMQNMKPVSPLMYAQEAALQNDVMAHVAVDECSQVYDFCQNSGEYNWFFCTALLIDCRIHQ